MCGSGGGSLGGSPGVEHLTNEAGGAAAAAARPTPTVADRERAAGAFLQWEMKLIRLGAQLPPLPLQTVQPTTPTPMAVLPGKEPMAIGESAVWVWPQGGEVAEGGSWYARPPMPLDRRQPTALDPRAVRATLLEGWEMAQQVTLTPPLPPEPTHPTPRTHPPTPRTHPPTPLRPFPSPPPAEAR